MALKLSLIDALCEATGNIPALHHWFMCISEELTPRSGTAGPKICTLYILKFPSPPSTRESHPHTLANTGYNRYFKLLLM